MLQVVEDHQLGIREFVGDEAIQAGVAATVELSGHHEARAGHLVQPRSHLGSRVHVEHAQEDLSWCAQYLLDAVLDGIRTRLDEAIGVPAVQQGVQHGLYAIGPHPGHDALHLGAVLVGATGRRREQHHAGDVVRMRPGVGGADLAAQGVADHVDPVMAQTDPQRLQVLDEFVQRIGNRRDGALAVAPQVVTDAGEVFLQTG